MSTEKKNTMIMEIIIFAILYSNMITIYINSPLTSDVNKNGYFQAVTLVDILKSMKNNTQTE